jgi:hypothetical protein
MKPILIMKPVASKRVYEVWSQLIQDEELYEAMLAGTHRDLTGRGLDDEAIEILDQFRSEPGTRWNVENARFRSSLFVGDLTLLYLPRTIRLLTGGNDQWRQDLCFEYLAHHRWRPMGHMQLMECERFAEFVRTRVMKRRVVHPHLETVMAYELAVIGLLRSTATLASDAWPVRRDLTDSELPAVRPRRSPVQVMMDFDIDFRPWIESGDPARGEVGPGPITLLVHMPSLDERYRIKTISDGVRVVLERCDGERTVDRLARELEDEFELPAAAVFRTVRTLLDERILYA